MHAMIWASKVAGIPIEGITGLPLGTKWPLSAGLMATHRKDYKVEGGGFPQVQAMVSLVSSCLPVGNLCTKNALTMH